LTTLAKASLTIIKIFLQYRPQQAMHAKEGWYKLFARVVSYVRNMFMKYITGFSVITTFLSSSLTREHKKL
jgi:hypothetical protein